VKYPDVIYGLGQTASFHLYDVPAGDGGTSPPATSGPQPAEFFTFSITAFDDGSAVASWQSAGGTLHQAYLPSFDLRYQGVVMKDIIHGTRAPTAPALPYQLFLMVGSAPKDPTVTGIVTPPTETDTLAKLTSQYQWTFDTMKDRVDWRAANGNLPPQTPKLFDDRGNPLKQFVRVEVSSIDSNLDGIDDENQFGAGAIGDPFDMDIDGDGIPNGYDRDLWPAAQFPATNALLDNVLINEALLSNEFTNVDDDGQCQDWVELYNPTNGDIDLTGWYLSDRVGTSSRRKWSFPGGTIIGSGEFLVIWASSKNRGGIEDLNGSGVLDPGEDLPNNGVFNNVLDPPRAFHANFGLSGGDSLATPPAQPESIALTNPGNVIVDRYQVGVTANYGPMRTDVSFGRFPSADGLKTGYLISPTPGAAGVVGTGSLGPVGQHNIKGAVGFTDPPIFDGASDLPGLYENTTVTAILSPPVSGGVLHFTTNSAHPTPYSELYSGPIEASRTKIVRAIAVREGYLPSTSITRSFLFKEDILGTSSPGATPTDQQGARTANGQFKGLLQGYPEETEMATVSLYYEMHPNVVRDHHAAISAGLDSIPIVSVVSDVAGFFDVDSGGLYPNSGKTDTHKFWGTEEPDPRNRDWQRLCSFEIVEENQTDFIQENACLSITGATSIYQWVSLKHNLRVGFHSSHGPDRLVYQLFQDSLDVEFTDFHLKNPTHDSWTQVSESHAQRATYCDEGWLRSAHRAMGHQNPHRRWVHLFLNGIYWGPYELTERVDCEYVRRISGDPNNITYDVIKPHDGVTDLPNVNGVAAADGTTTAWDDLIELCEDLNTSVANGDDLLDQDALYAQILARMDMDNYIDYPLCYAYAHGQDWPENNFRIARRNNLGDRRFRFYIWDAEVAFAPSAETASGAANIDGPGAARPHSLLKNYSGYRQKFAERVRRHFHEQPAIPGSGVLAENSTGDLAVQLYQSEMARFQGILYCESARWGAVMKSTPYTFSDPSVAPGNPKQGDWLRRTNYVVNTWLPKRRELLFEDLAQENLYVTVSDDSLPGGQVGLLYDFPLSLIGGELPRTATLAYGTLPPGLDIMNNSLYGYPTTAGSFTFTIKVTSSDSVDGEARPLEGLSQFQIIVAPAQ